MSVSGHFSADYVEAREGGGEGSDGPPSAGNGGGTGGPEPDADDDDGGDDDDHGSPGTDDGNAPADASDDGDPQAHDGPAEDGPSDAPASCDPSATGEVMDAPSGSGDDASAGQAPPDVSADEQAWDEAMHQALNLAKTQGKAPGAVEETIRDAHRSTLDWRSLLRRYMTDAAARDYSWSVSAMRSCSGASSPSGSRPLSAALSRVPAGRSSSPTSSRLRSFLPPRALSWSSALSAASIPSRAETRSPVAASRVSRGVFALSVTSSALWQARLISTRKLPLEEVRARSPAQRSERGASQTSGRRRVAPACWGEMS